MSTEGNGNGVARYGGQPWTINDGSTLAIPEFNIDEAELYIALQAKVRDAGADAVAQRAIRDEIVQAIHLAVSRNYPELTLETFRKGITFKGMIPFMMFVAKLNGLIPEDAENPPVAVSTGP